MSDKDNVKDNILAYFKSQLGLKFSSTKLKGNYVFTCPDCKLNKPSCGFTESIYKVECHNCGFKGSILDCAVILDKNLKALDLRNEIQIEEYLNRNYKIKFPKLVDLYFDFYEKNKFDLVPLIKNQKVPFEQDWLNKPYTVKADWYKLYETGYNLGIKTGKKSNITVIDFDTKEVPEIFYQGSPIVQKTTRGFHFIFKYEEDLSSGKIQGMKIDILNDGKQFVAYPSVIDGIGRNWNFTNLSVEIPKMSEEIKNYILSFSKDSTREEITADEKIIEDIRNNIVNSPDIKKMGANSGRNETLVRYGGILRKQLNLKDTEYVLGLLNQNLFNPPLHPKEVSNLVKSLDKYITTDERDLAKKIFHYLKYAEEGTSQDIERAIGEKKDRIDKALAFLVKEEIIIKRGRNFILIKKIEWREDFPNLINEVNFKVPYFHDVMYFNWGDLLLLGGQTGTGKTTISMNFIKKFVEAGVKPHYICNEAGCFDDQTEILTKYNGWKLFKNLSKEDLVATLNPKTKELEYQKPVHYFEYDYNDKLCFLDNQSISVAVTPNHKQPVITDSNVFKFVEFKDFKNHQNIPRGCTWVGKEQKYFTLPSYTYRKFNGRGKKYYSVIKPEIKIKMNNWLEFLGLYIAEGSSGDSSCSISQFVKVDECESIIKKLPFKYRKNKVGFRIKDCRLANYLKQFKTCSYKFVPQYIKELSPRQIEFFLKGYHLGDGSYNGKSRAFFTTSKQLADDLQELIFKCGKIANIHTRNYKNTVMKIKDKEYIRNHDLYCLTENTFTLNYCYSHRNKFIYKKYIGKVYDVEVPKYHTLYVRRNNKPYWSGNSRFIKTATQLGLKEGDFKWSIQVDPTKIEIEPNTVCILDWLMIADKANSDSVLKYFVEQLVKTNSFLIIFMQLKKDNTWFAPNMVEQFPAFAARYIYDEDSNGVTGSWIVDKIRDAKTQRKGGGIPCKYDWHTKILSRIDELENKPKQKTESTVTDEVVV